MSTSNSLPIHKAVDDSPEITVVDDEWASKIRSVEKLPDAPWVKGLEKENSMNPAAKVISPREDVKPMMKFEPQHSMTSLLAPHLTQDEIYHHIKHLRRIGCVFSIFIIFASLFVYRSEALRIISLEMSGYENDIMDLLNSGMDVSSAEENVVQPLFSFLQTQFVLYLTRTIFSFLFIMYACRLGALSDNFVVFLATGCVALSMLGTVGLAVMKGIATKNMDYSSMSMFQTLMVFQWVGWFSAVVSCTFWSNTPTYLFMSLPPLVFAISETIGNFGLVSPECITLLWFTSVCIITFHCFTVCTDPASKSEIARRPINHTKVHAD